MGFAGTGLWPSCRDHQQWGIAAVALFYPLRFIDGASFSAGSTPAYEPLAMEYSPKEKRGSTGDDHTSYPLAYAAISLLTLILLQLYRPAILTPPMRVGLEDTVRPREPDGFRPVIYYIREVHESGARESGGPSLLRGAVQRAEPVELGRSFVLMGGFGRRLYGFGHAPRIAHLRASSGTRITIALSIAFHHPRRGYVAAGVISQKIGRRPYLIANAIVMATVGTLPTTCS